MLGDSVTPILDAGLAQLVELDHVISPEIRLTPSIGHTPGHVSVMIESEGERAVITGDMAHPPASWRTPTGCSATTTRRPPYSPARASSPNGPTSPSSSSAPTSPPPPPATSSEMAQRSGLRCDSRLLASDCDCWIDPCRAEQRRGARHR
jgi:hypothetical protein